MGVRFKVTASRTVFQNPPRNPFLVGIHEFGRAITTTRVWEFEAENEAQVRKHWDEAQKQYLENVVGFTLDKIEALPDVS